MPARTKSGAGGAAVPTTPSVCIYQNSDYVTEVLQQMVTLGILTNLELQQTTSQSTSHEGTSAGGAGAAAKLKVPLVGEIDAKVDGDATRRSGGEDANDQVSRQQYRYSEAYYLHVIRQRLREQGLCELVTRSTSQLKVGAFVEFEATFRADEINAVLDIASPELVAAVVSYRARAEANRTIYDAGYSFEERRAQAEKAYAKAENSADLARAVTRAVRTDFRSDATREFFGSLSEGGDVDGLAAVTICDTKHFLVEDVDRILDGTFTVLGKVCSPIERDRSLFDRNKLLNRVNVEFMDGVFRKLQEVVAESPVNNEFTKGIDTEPFNAELSARLDGRSFKVMPIAIYI